MPTIRIFEIVHSEGDVQATLIFASEPALAVLNAIIGCETLRCHVLREGGYDPAEKCCPGELGERRGCTDYAYRVREVTEVTIL